MLGPFLFKKKGNRIMTVKVKNINNVTETYNNVESYKREGDTLILMLPTTKKYIMLPHVKEYDIERGASSR